MEGFNLTNLIFAIIGGLGLFVLGIKMMGDGLQKAAGHKMKEILSHLTRNRFIGLGIGTLVTSIIQSSSATSVIIVGFINAGLMNLIQAIPVIFGANIGTTVTAQIIAFKLTDYALPVVGIGVSMYLFGKRERTKQYGEAILGFGVLFLGLNIMSEGVKPLGQSAMIKEFFTKFSYNPFLGVLVGTIVTAIIQSSSVSTGMVLALAGVGLLDLRGAIPIVLGANIGTCVTALLASIGTNLSAKRAAVSHIMFNFIGTLITLALFPLYYFLTIRSSNELVRQIANFHTMFNVLNSTLFIGFVPLYAKLVEKIVPGKEIIIERGPKYLDRNLLKTPSIAVEAAKKEILRALEFSKEMIENAMRVFYTESRKDIQRVLTKEDMVDELQTAITNYLVKITEKELNEDEARAIPSLIHSINDIERIADHATNIVEIAERKIDNKIKLSKEAQEEIKKMYDVVSIMVDDVIKALPYLNREITKEVFRNENKLNSMFVEFRRKHCERLGKKICTHLGGLVFIDLLMNFEKIGDHLTNIAQAIEGKLQWNPDDV